MTLTVLHFIPIKSLMAVTLLKIMSKIKSILIHFLIHKLINIELEIKCHVLHLFC